MTVARDNPTRKTIVVTRDINMRVKCDSLGLVTEDYILNEYKKHFNEQMIEMEGYTSAHPM